MHSPHGPLSMDAGLHQLTWNRPSLDMVCNHCSRSFRASLPAQAPICVEHHTSGIAIPGSVNTGKVFFGL